MTEEEFQTLEDLLREQFEAIGAADLADPRAYLVREGAEELTRTREPRGRLLEMLEALERRLEIQDHATFEKSMAIFTQNIDGPVPERVLVEQIPTEREFVVDLSASPDLIDLRMRVRKLRDDLAETPYET